MVALKGSGIENFLRKPDQNIKAALFYGPDTGLVAELAKRLVLTRVSDADDPFNVSRLEDSDLAGDPGRLVDEACAQSLMGGERVVWIRAAGAGSAAALDSYLSDPSGDAIIIVEAGELKPSAKLRKVAEQSKQAVAIACYGDSGRTIEDLVDTEMTKANLSMTPDARQLLISILGADRQVTRRELEKLILYVNGKGNVEIEDVDAICGDAGSATMDTIVDAAAEGRVDIFDVSYQTAVASGVTATGILLACSRHMTRLQLMSPFSQSRFGDEIGAAADPFQSPAVRSQAAEDLVRRRDCTRDSVSGRNRITDTDSWRPWRRTRLEGTHEHCPQGQCSGPEAILNKQTISSY